MTSRLKIFLPLFLILAAAGWYWLMPHYSNEDKAYYVSVFCTLPHHDNSRSITDMRRVIEGGNSDYALQKIHFQPRLGEQVVSAWQALSAEQKAQAGADAGQCRTLLSAALH
ncbi:hypothetical protein HP564_18950 [Pantoea sp. KPR_PJ]